MVLIGCICKKESCRPWIEAWLVILYEVDELVWPYPVLLFELFVCFLCAVGCPPSCEHEHILFRYRNAAAVPVAVRHDLVGCMAFLFCLHKVVFRIVPVLHVIARFRISEYHPAVISHLFHEFLKELDCRGNSSEYVLRID